MEVIINKSDLKDAVDTTKRLLDEKNGNKYASIHFFENDAVIQSSDGKVGVSVQIPLDKPNNGDIPSVKFDPFETSKKMKGKSRPLSCQIKIVGEEVKFEIPELNISQQTSTDKKTLSIVKLKKLHDESEGFDYLINSSGFYNAIKTSMDLVTLKKEDPPSSYIGLRKKFVFSYNPKIITVLSNKEGFLNRDINGDVGVALRKEFADCISKSFTEKTKLKILFKKEESTPMVLVKGGKKIVYTQSNESDVLPEFNSAKLDSKKGRRAKFRPEELKKFLEKLKEKKVSKITIEFNGQKEVFMYDEATKNEINIKGIYGDDTSEVPNIVKIDYDVAKKMFEGIEDNDNILFMPYSNNKNENMHVIFIQRTGEMGITKIAPLIFVPKGF